MLRLVFLSCFGFTGGVLYLLFLLVPFEQWLSDRETSRHVVDMLLGILTFGWVLISLCATALYGFFFLSRREDLLAGIGVLGFGLIASVATFYFLLDADLMVAFGEMNQEEAWGERFTFGAYPDARKIEQLKDEGYDGVITLLNPKIPFERVLLKQELAAGEEADLPVHSYPMLPWISQNQESLRGIEELTAADETKRYYVNCYLGKHRVDYVRQALSEATGEPAKVNQEPLPKSFERGRVIAFDNEEVILGPYPTEEEWFNFVIRRGVKEVISTLDPDKPKDAARIEEERRIAEENGLVLTLRPLDPETPDPRAVQELAAYAESRQGKVYVHDFLESERFEALESALRGTASGGRQRAEQRPVP